MKGFWGQLLCSHDWNVKTIRQYRSQAHVFAICKKCGKPKLFYFEGLAAAQMIEIAKAQMEEAYG